MLAHQRQERILDAVRHHGGARVADLVAKLGVSDMTVRRDIADLSRRGLLVRVHGGAVAAGAGRSSEEPGFAAKAVLQVAAKRAVAERAARLVGPGASVALSAGTTTVEVARRLDGLAGLTVVTNSPRVADVLHDPDRPDRSVVLTGGVRTPSDALVGPVAVAALRDLHVDVLLLGVHGLDPDAGITTPNLDEADTNRALVDAARRVVVVADSSKWGVVGLRSVAALGAVDVLVTDTGLSREARAVLADQVGELLLATPCTTTGTPGTDTPGRTRP